MPMDGVVRRVTLSFDGLSLCSEAALLKGTHIPVGIYGPGRSPASHSCAQNAHRWALGPHCNNAHRFVQHRDSSAETAVSNHEDLYPGAR